MLHFDTEPSEFACCTHVSAARKLVKRLWPPEWRKDLWIETRSVLRMEILMAIPLLGIKVLGSFGIKDEHPQKKIVEGPHGLISHAYLQLFPF